MMDEYCRKIFAVILGLAGALCLPAFGQENSSGNTNLLQPFLPSGCYHAGQYRQEKKLAGLEQPLVTEGNFVYTCGKGLIWHTETPITETVIYKISGEHFTLDAENQLNPLDGRVHKALGTLLNHLIGGNPDYLRRHFQAIIVDERLRLQPKQRRMKNFLQFIDIAPQEESVQIKLQHNAGETTHISISGRQTFADFNLQDCKLLLPQQTFACGALFL